MNIKKVVSTAVAASIAAGTIVIPVGAVNKEKNFFDSVIRYISFDSDIKDVQDRTAVATEVTTDVGKYGNAGVFNGTSSTIDIGKIDVSRGKSFTVGYWIKAGENADSVVVGNKDWESGSNLGWTTGIYKNALKANTGYGSNDKEKRSDTASYTLNSEEWTYITAVFDMQNQGLSTVKLYVNGDEYSTRRIVAGSLETDFNTVIGMDAGNVRFFTGMIDEFIMCDKALTDGEIKYAMSMGEESTFEEIYNQVENSEFFELSENNGTVKLGETVNVPVVYQGTSIDVKNASYTSLNEEVATVSQTGEITPKALGTTVISVEYDDGTITYSGEYTLKVTGNSYRMTDRIDKSANPSQDGWGFMYAAKGTDTYGMMESYTESGDIWRKSSSSADLYTRINGSGYGHHPGADNDVVIAWTAPETGYVNIKGTIAATAYSATNTDGINLTVIKNLDAENPIDKINVTFDNDFQNGGKTLNKNTVVTAGDTIYFRVDNDVNNSSDGFNFDPVITYIDEEATIELKNDSIELSVGDEIDLPLNIVGDIDTSMISYISVNPNVATVDSSGKISAVKLGTTLIKVAYNKNNVTYNGICVIKVVGDKYQMSTRADKTGNPSQDGWGFVYVPIGTNDYVDFEKHSESSDEWSTATEGYTRINASGSNSHPGSKHDVAVTWTAPKDGYVNIGGHIENTNSASSDGIKLSVMNGEKVLTTLTTKNDGGKDLDKTVFVNMGDTIYFRVNCVSGNGNDQFKFDPSVTYTDGTIETNADKYMIQAGSEMSFTADTENFTAASLDENIATVDGLKINGISEGDTKILLISDDKTKIIDVNVTSTKQDYKFSFDGAKETNSGAICRIFMHMNTGTNRALISDLSLDVAFDNNVIEILDYKGNPITSANEKGRYRITANPLREMSSTYKFDGTLTKVKDFYIRVKDENATSTTLTVKEPVINGVAIQEELCTIAENKITIHTNPTEDKNEDGLISIGDITIAAANGADNTVLKGISDKCGFYPIKRVFVVGIDGAGNSIDPENAWYQYSDASGNPTGNEVKFSTIGGKQENQRWKFYEETILKDGAYTVEALPCNPSMSAPNWTAILHGYNYYDAPTDTSSSIQRLDNDDAGANYFPESESKWSSFMKLAREQMPNRNLISNSNWTAIDYGIIEQSIGVWSIPYSSRFAYDGRDGQIAKGIADQIANGDAKNMSVMFVHLDELDHIGHDAANGFYSDNYYKEASENKDNQVKMIYEAIYNNDELKDDTIFITTTDHGGQSHYHGGKEPSELYSFITINGSIINNGYTWKGDVTDETAKIEDSTRSQTRDVPAIVAKSLGLTPDSDWKGSLNRASGAFLTQKEMIKKERDIETVEYGNKKISVTNLKNIVTGMDITFSYSGETAPQITTQSSTNVISKTIDTENKTVHMIMYNADGFGSDCIVSDTDVDVTNVMLATSQGKEIYADILEAQISTIESVTAIDDNKLTIDNISSQKQIKINVNSPDEKTDTKIIVAAYDINGVLIGITINDCAKNIGMESVTVDNPSFEKDNVNLVKVMWLTDMQTLKPITAEAAEIK